jgi:putative restriction endonuclease
MVRTLPAGGVALSSRRSELLATDEPGSIQRGQGRRAGLFRLGAPTRAIAGFGYFASQPLMSVDMAWEVFGEKNGDPDKDSFVERIASFRRRFGLTHQNGRLLKCLILRDAVFLPKEDWIPWDTREGWSDNNVSVKGYDLADGAGEVLFEFLQLHGGRRPPDLEPYFDPSDEDSRILREQMGVVRQGQGTFRVRVLDAYGGRCSVTGEHAVPVLDAAHITPYLGVRSNHVQNGLVLRADLHRLYDDGYVTVTPDYLFMVSQRLNDEFENGKIYYEMAGRRVLVPGRPELRPSRAALEWHVERVFR